MIRIFEAFAGVGAQKMALRNIDIEHESVGIAEVNEPAILSYAVIHSDVDFVETVSVDEMQKYMERLNIPLNDKGKRVMLKGERLVNLYKASVASHNYGDISSVSCEDLPDMDLFTYSFPCQSVSFAGLGNGLAKDSGTRSSLLWECERVIEAKRPPYLLMENVKALISKKHKPDFDKWRDLVEELGYNNYWAVLNAKDFGIPQNRERVFMVSIRKDIDQTFVFPEKIKLTKTVQDLLEFKVSEDMYFARDKVDVLVLSDKVLEERLRSRTLDRNLLLLIAASRGRYVDNPKLRQVGLPTKQHLEINFKGLSNTLTSVQKDNYVVEHVDNYVGIDAHPFSKKLEYTSFKNRDVISCLLATDYKSPKAVAFQLSDQLRIRKLLPLECWRLMGFTDEDFKKAESVVSNTQLYKQAGNSIVVPVLEAIFGAMFVK